LKLSDEGPTIPVFRPRKDEMSEPLKSQIEAKDKLEREEHWRLLYVAMTRAEERLYVGGSLGPADKNGPPEASWFAAVDSSLTGLGADWQEDPLWGCARRFVEPEVPASKGIAKADRIQPELPAWLLMPAPLESRPPRPLAPSAMGEDAVPNPPPSPEMRMAAERGKLLHQLFERLPAVPPSGRTSRADAWLAQSAGIEDAGFRRSLVEDACRIISDPRFSDIFGADALAEAPIAAVTPDGSVISGTVDRLLVGEDMVRVMDFKTGRAVPASAQDIPLAHLRQMAAYVAALEVIFPGRTIQAGLLYTSGPTLHPLSRALLAPYMPQQAALAG
jgi:ATP-dependent helicase/nuclease subunit A